MKRDDSKSSIWKYLQTGLMLTILLVSGMVNGQTTVNSLEELQTYLDKDDVHVQLSPGTYSITAEDLKNGYQLKEVEIKHKAKVLLLFEGNNSTYDFTGVTLYVDTKVFSSLGYIEVNEVQIIGNNNVLKNLTIVDQGTVYDAPTRRARNIVMDGSHNRVEGFHVTAKGSFPYGYGDAFGKGKDPVIPHRKHSACLIRGESNHLKGSTFIHRSYGHCVFMQAASNPIIEGNYIEGEVRKTDDMLEEAGSGSPADKVGFMTKWGYKLPKGYMLSTGEAGIRAYNGGETLIDGKLYNRGTSNPTVLNNVIKYMRTGVTISHATGKKYVEGCLVMGCENGYSLGVGEVVNCRADCIYGPVYTSTYQSDGEYNADITIVSSSEPYCNGSGSVAYIGGSDHKIVLKGSSQGVSEGLRIRIGGEKNNIRLLNGNFSNQNNFIGSDLELQNLTTYPVYITEECSDIHGQSLGEVHDQGVNNTIAQKKISLEGGSK